jgi:hypothetical protein
LSKSRGGSRHVAVHEAPRLSRRARAVIRSATRGICPAPVNRSTRYSQNLFPCFRAVFARLWSVSHARTLRHSVRPEAHVPVSDPPRRRRSHECVSARRRAGFRKGPALRGGPPDQRPPRLRAGGNGIRACAYWFQDCRRGSGPPPCGPVCGAAGDAGQAGLTFSTSPSRSTCGRTCGRIDRFAANRHSKRERRWRPERHR